MKKLIIRILYYFRVSTKSNFQKGSYENQPEFLEKIRCRKASVDKEKEYKYIDKACDWGISGTGFLNRDGFTKMLTDFCGLKVTKIEFESIPHPTIEGGTLKQIKYIVSVDPNNKPKIDEIWVKSCSRFARNINAIDIIQTLRMAKVYLYVADINQSTRTADGMQAIMDEITRAERFSSNLSVTISIAKEQMAENNIVSGCPIGYEYHKVERKGDSYTPAHYTIHPIYGPMIKLCYELAHQGYGFKSISNILANDYGIYAPNGKPFGTTTINRILSNPKYKGINVVNRWETGKLWEKLTSPKERTDYIEKESECVPQLVPVELWEQVQEDVKSRRNKETGKGSYSPQHPYKDKLICRYCGKGFIFSKENEENGDNSHFRCSTKRTKGVKYCNCNNVYVYQIDNYLDKLAKEDLQWLIQRDSESVITSLVVTLEKYIHLLNNPTTVNSPKLKELQEQAQTLDRQYNRLKKIIVYNNDDSEDISEDDMKELNKIKTQINAVNKEIAELSLLPNEIKDRIELLFTTIFEEIEAYKHIKKRYTRDEVLDLVEKIVVAGRTVCSTGGKAPRPILMPYLKQTAHFIEILEKCKADTPHLFTNYQHTPYEEEEYDICEILDSDDLYDEKRQLLRSLKKFQKSKNENNTQTAGVYIDDNKLIEKALKEDNYYSLVMADTLDYGFENKTIIKQIKDYVQSLYDSLL